MKITILNILILFVFVIGIVGAGEIVWIEINVQGICPKFLSIPVCFIILICLIVSLVTHVLNLGNNIYYILIGIGFVIAVVGSIKQFIGTVFVLNLLVGLRCVTILL